MLHSLSVIWDYRNFIFSSIRGEFAKRIVRSRLGALWMVINPLAMVGIYAFILSNVLSSRLPGATSKYAYTIYLIAGQIGWNLFSEIIMNCTSVFIREANILKKIRFPRFLLPIIVLGVCIVDNILLISIALVLFFVLGHAFTLHLLWLVFLTALTTLLALSIGLTVGIVNVFVRDVGQVVPIILQVLFWFTPIVYPESIVPGKYLDILRLNPMVSVVSGYHQVIVNGQLPDFFELGKVLAVSFVLFAFSLFIYKKANQEMVDEL